MGLYYLFSLQEATPFLNPKISFEIMYGKQSSLLSASKMCFFYFSLSFIASGFNKKGYKITYQLERLPSEVMYNSMGFTIDPISPRKLQKSWNIM